MEFALILAYIYCLVQMLVLVGILVSVFSPSQDVELYCNPNAMFFFLVVGTFLLCGILHPFEMRALIHGLTYYLAIPTMYLILMIYAMCNLNIVSWGTRETKQPAPAGAPIEKNPPKEQSGLAGLLHRIKVVFGGSKKKDAVQLVNQSQRESVASVLDEELGRVSDAGSYQIQPLQPGEDAEVDQIVVLRRTSVHSTVEESWITDPDLGDGPIDKLDDDEKEFFDVRNFNISLGDKRQLFC